jgi:hypothetical protein
MPDCQNLDFSPTLSAKRMANAELTSSVPALKRLLCFALFLLGANRSAIARSLYLPLDTAKSVVKTLQRDGLSALEDRRRRHSSFLPPPPQSSSPKIDLSRQDDGHVIQLGSPSLTITVAHENSLQLRTLLLTFLQNGLLTKEQAAAQLGLSAGHAVHLAQALHEKDAGVLIDKRQGQQDPYRVDRDMMRFIIEQFIIDLVSEGTTSGKELCQHLHERCGVELKERTARHHMGKLGLIELKRTLPQKLSDLKKTP